MLNSTQYSRIEKGKVKRNMGLAGLTIITRGTAMRPGIRQLLLAVTLVGFSPGCGNGDSGGGSAPPPPPPPAPPPPLPISGSFGLSATDTTVMMNVRKSVPLVEQNATTCSAQILEPLFSTYAIVRSNPGQPNIVSDAVSGDCSGLQLNPGSTAPNGQNYVTVRVTFSAPGATSVTADRRFWYTAPFAAGSYVPTVSASSGGPAVPFCVPNPSGYYITVSSDQPVMTAPNGTGYLGTTLEATPLFNSPHSVTIYSSAHATKADYAQPNGTFGFWLGVTTAGPVDPSIIGNFLQQPIPGGGRDSVWIAVTSCT